MRKEVTPEEIEEIVNQVVEIFEGKRMRVVEKALLAITMTALEAILSEISEKHDKITFLAGFEMDFQNLVIKPVLKSGIQSSDAKDLFNLAKDVMKTLEKYL